MGDPDSIDLSTIDWRKLTPDEREQLQQRIIERAYAARARALQELFRLPLWLVRRGAAALAALWRAGAALIERRRAVRELSTLDDRSLRDIGLTRSEIDAAVRGQGPDRAPPEPFVRLARHKPTPQRSPAMTPEQKCLIQETWTKVVPIADAAVTLFYNRLFEIDPSTRSLFKATNMAEQRKKLIQTLAFALQGLDKLDELIPVVENLGRRHVGYGVTAKHYESVGAALLWTFEQGLGKAWTPEAAAAWTELYGILSSVMQRAANEPSKHAA